jgi:NADH-quinone oxidoreductase subunit J
MSNIVLYILLGLIVVSSLFAVMKRNTLKAIIALAIVSATLTIVMFMLGAPLAAVFELSVCAGLVTAIFISTISLTDNRTAVQDEAFKKKRRAKYIYLPIIIIVVVGIVFIMKPALNFSSATSTAIQSSVQHTIWHERNLDIAGQIIVILAGVYGVVILFKEKTKN